MPGPTFDVYLTGSKEANPSGHMRTIATIASRHRLPAATVAAALEDPGTPCRIGERLPRPEAEALVAALGALGAVARLNPAGAPFEPRSMVTADAEAPDRKDGRVTLKSAESQIAPLVELSEPIEFAEPGPDGRTGVRGADTVRCPVHGLIYNRRQASGCVRCLAPARARARQLEARQPDKGDGRDDRGRGRGGHDTTASSRFRSLRGNPVRRAFWGLAFALVLGFVPAAYHARASTRNKVGPLRAQQVEIAAAPITRAALARFDDLDAQVRAAYLRGAGRTLLIWLVVAGAAGAAWTKLT